MTLNKRDFLNKTKKDFYEEIKKYQKSLKPTKEIEGFAGSSIVGEKNYPNIKIHNISNENKNNHYMKTSEIVKRDYSDIIKAKARNILGSTESINIRKSDEKIKKEIEDIYKSKNEVNFTSKFQNELKFNKIILNKFSGIVGNKNEITNIESNENTKTSKKIEKYTLGDIKAKNAVIDLYEKGTNEHQIINLLSIGSFGKQINKKLVPTRWAITTYDKIIEEFLFKKIYNNKIDNFYRLFYSIDKGNEFLILTLPDNIKGTIIEKFSINKEIDSFNDYNKLDKKEPMTAGGYYSTKLSIFEHLHKSKRQSSFISSRIIKEYDIPLGVVFVREMVRKAMKTQILKSNSFEEVKEFINLNYSNHLNDIINSKTIKQHNSQKKLSNFFN